MANVLEVTKWAEHSLLSQGYIINSLSEDVQTTPWSLIKRFSTNVGYIYLKQTAALLSLEPLIIKILTDRFHASVPKIIDINKNLNCFLMADAGMPLREYLKQQFNVELLTQSIKQYTYIQSAAADHISIFLAVGVPDWRLSQLPNLYEQLIQQENLLKQEGLTHNELDMLRKLHPRFSAMCELLSDYKLPESIDHGDFHANNILIDDNQSLVVIDWCEAVITHPFFSLVTFLNQAALHYHLRATDSVYITLQESCFDSWLAIMAKPALLDAFILTKQLWPIYAALVFHRLMMSSDATMFKSFYANRSDRLASYFREFIKNTSL